MSTAGMAFVKEHAAGEISPGRLRRYLCDEACSPGQKEVRAEACRSCESACAYGRRFLRLLDAGEITTEGKAVKRQIKHGKGEAQKMGQAPKENERTGKTRQPAQAAERVVVRAALRGQGVTLAIGAACHGNARNGCIRGRIAPRVNVQGAANQCAKLRRGKRRGQRTQAEKFIRGGHVP